MSNYSSEKASMSPSDQPRGERRIRHLTALAMFVIFALGFVTPAMLAGPAEQVETPSPTSSTEDALSQTETGNAPKPTPEDYGPSEYCGPALDVAITISADFLNTQGGGLSDLEQLIDLIDGEIGTSYTGPDPVRRAMAAISVSAKRAISPQRTNQERSPAGLSESLNRPFTTDAVDTIFARCE